MILLDIDNLNILVLFILAFISFKSYHADHHAIESESQSEISEAEDVKQDVVAQQIQEEKPKMRSQSEQNDEQHSQGLSADEKEQVKNHDPSQMINEQIVHSGIYPNLDGIQQGENQPIQEGDNLKTEAQNLKEISKNEVFLIEKCDEQISKEQNDSGESLKNPESESYLSEGDDQDQENEDQTNIQPEKRKKIHKTARKLKRELRKQLEAVGELREEIEIQ